MNYAVLLAVASGPVFLLLHGIYVADHYEKEPIRNMLRYVFFGALVCIPAGIVELLVLNFPGLNIFGDTAVNPVVFVITIFLGIAFVEEAGKRAMLKWCARRDHNINEPFDWIVYSVAVSLGFALLENILYVFMGGVPTGLLRAVTAVPEHALCGTFMGERLARAALLQKAGAFEEDIRHERRMALIEPAIWHGFYDAFALGASRAGAGNLELLSAVLKACLVVFIIIQWTMGFVRVRIQQKRAGAGRRVPPILISKKLL